MRRSTMDNETTFGELTALNQRTAVQEPDTKCEERRQLGQQILIDKVHHFDSMLSRFVGNFISLFSNSTNTQEVS